eukprot:scpid80215/ scgid27072/ Sperm motility kinase 2B
MATGWPIPFPMDLFGEFRQYNESRLLLDDMIIFEREKLGEGSFAAVHVARMIGMEPAAAKIFRYQDKDERYTMTCSELRIVQKLRHPNIAACYGAMQCEQWPVIFFERVEGVTLRTMYMIAHADRRFLQEAKLRPIFQQLFVALHYLQTAKIVHADIKYDNVMVTDDGVVKLIDFGCAQDISRGKATRARPGMYTYPPEINIEGMGGYDHKADMFLAGGLLYFLLTYTQPFGDFAQIPAEDHAKRLLEGPNRQRPQYQTLSKDVRRFIEALLAYRPESRPDAAEALQMDWITRAPDYRPLALIDYEPEATLQCAQDLNADVISKMARYFHVDGDLIATSILEDSNCWQMIVYRARLHEMEVLTPRPSASTVERLRRVRQFATRASTDEGLGSSLETNSAATAASTNSAPASATTTAASVTSTSAPQKQQETRSRRRRRCIIC